MNTTVPCDSWTKSIMFRLILLRRIQLQFPFAKPHRNEISLLSYRMMCLDSDLLFLSACYGCIFLKAALYPLYVKYRAHSRNINTGFWLQNRYCLYKQAISLVVIADSMWITCSVLINSTTQVEQHEGTVHIDRVALFVHVCPLPLNHLIIMLCARQWNFGLQPCSLSHCKRLL